MDTPPGPNLSPNQEQQQPTTPITPIAIGLDLYTSEDTEISKANSSTVTTDILECPICYDTLMPPINQCYNGHLICGACIEKVEECPVCREAMPEKRIRNRAVEDLTKDWLYNCVNKMSGCTFKLKPADIEAHRLQCDFVCLPFCEFLGISSCNHQSTKSQICHHMATEHGVPILEMERNRAQIHYLIVKSDQDDNRVENKILLWRPVIFQCFDEMFYLKCEFNPLTQSLTWTPFVQFVGEDIKKIRVTLKVISISQEVTVEWKGPVHCLFEKSERETPALVLPLKSYESLFKSDNNEGEGGILFLDITIEELMTTSVEQDQIQVIWDPHLTTPESVPMSSESVRTFGRGAVRETFPGVRLMHFGVTCDICSAPNIVGIRYKCLECEDYDVCEICEKTSTIHDHHMLVRLASVQPQIRVADIISRSLGFTRRRSYRGTLVDQALQMRPLSEPS